MNALARFLVTLVLCLPGLTTAAEDEYFWEPVETRIGQWVLRSVHGDITAAMKNTGLLFIATYHCPLGSVNERGRIVWYAGDFFSTYAIDCDGHPDIENVSFHIDEEFFFSLPLLARIHYRETALTRNASVSK